MSAFGIRPGPSADHDVDASNTQLDRPVRVSPDGYVRHAEQAFNLLEQLAGLPQLSDSFLRSFGATVLRIAYAP
jgi:hypothetical protein